MMIAAALAHHAERLKNKGVRAPSRASADGSADVREALRAEFIDACEPSTPYQRDEAARDANNIETLAAEAARFIARAKRIIEGLDSGKRDHVGELFEACIAENLTDALDHSYGRSEAAALFRAELALAAGEN